MIDIKQASVDRIEFAIEQNALPRVPQPSRSDYAESAHDLVLHIHPWGFILTAFNCGSSPCEPSEMFSQLLNSICQIEVLSLASFRFPSKGESGFIRIEK